MGGIEKTAEMISLAGKTAVVSGGASGIGLGSARLLAGVGAAVALLDVDGARGKTAEQEIRGLGGEAEFYRCDVTVASDCERVVADVVRKFGRVDVLVNSAGVIRRRSVTDLTEQQWDQVVDVCLKGIYLLSHSVVPYMIECGGGSIVNIGSGWSLRGGPDAAAYCAAKGGVLNLTRAMAVDHGKQGIRVNCVCPGDVDTPLLRSEAEQLGADMDEFMKEAARRPLGRVGTPEDVAKAVLFFASDMSSWVTGAHLVVDGGGLA
jgi:NAD(P)-dependent dehydrogenase (short-subunit alcohol dehydrogenase family)